MIYLVLIADLRVSVIGESIYSVQVNRLGGLRLSTNSVVRFTDMTIAVYRGR